MENRGVFVKGFMLHITHYDPRWCRGGAKTRERPFDVNTALQIVEAMAATGMNLLVVDCADGVAYKSHPELRRHYTVPMNHLIELAACARENGIDVVPKLNFSKSGRNLHDMWMRPYADLVHWLKNEEDYWRVARDLIHELTEACQPRRYFHVGMDEDHYRSLGQYVTAIRRLRKIVKERRLRTVIWNDSCYNSKGAIAQVHAEKCRAAERHLPRDIVHVVWHYRKACPSDIRRLAHGGFESWAAPGPDASCVGRWRKAVKSQGGKGLLMTRWIKCSKANRGHLVEMVRELGPLYE